jgi:co-chaperonin GroES (HSP10)
MTITEVNKEMVLIKPDPIEEVAAGGIIKPEEAKMKEMKSQNRGVVLLVGSDCHWAKKGDYISFYRNAATEIPDGDESYVLIAEGHCLVKFKK